MARALIAAWAFSIITEAALALRIVRCRWWRRLPVFTVFIAVDLLRSMGMFAVWLWGTRQQYAAGFMVTEWPDMILFCTSGIEAFARRFSEPPPLPVYALIVGLVLTAGYGLPPAENVPLNRMFMQRSLVAFSVAAVLLVGSAWCECWPGWHAGILAAFAVIDLIAYFSLALFPEWAKTDPYSAPLLVTVGQGLCWLAWTVAPRWKTTRSF